METILKDTSQVLQNCTEIHQKQHGRDRLCLMWIASGFIKVQTELHRKPSGLGDCQQQEALIDGRGLREPPPLLVILQTRRPTFLRKVTLPLTACHVRKETNRTLSTLVNYFTFWKRWSKTHNFQDLLFHLVDTAVLSKKTEKTWGCGAQNIREVATKWLKVEKNIGFGWMQYHLQNVQNGEKPQIHNSISALTKLRQTVMVECLCASVHHQTIIYF